MSEYLCKKCGLQLKRSKKGIWSHYEATDCVPELEDDDKEFA